MTVEEIFKRHIKPLPQLERLRLLAMIAEDLTNQPPVEDGAEGVYDWMALRGIAPGLLAGEDAQHWVSRTRRESDEQRAVR